MAGVTTMRKIQIGEESVAGTEVAATTIWRGIGTINDETEVQFSEEHVGMISPTLRSFISQYIATLQTADTELTFEQLPLILSAGIKDVAGVQDGAGTGYIYTYPMAQGTLNSIQTYTLEMGNNQQEEQMLYSFVREFNISGAAGEPMMMNATWQGRQVAPGTFTGAVSLPTVENAVFQKGKLYVDAVGGSFGGTQVTLTIASFALAVTTGVTAFWTADGDLFFQGIDYVRPTVELSMTFKHNSTAVTEIANWRAETPRLVRFEVLGSALATPGAENNKRLTIDMAGKFATVGPLEDDNDNDMRSFTMRGGYDETAADFMSIEVVNELSTLL